ncbi:MAG: BCCT family transporter [Enterobacterales bacterium]|nr:BCCT family transporter [Enterobacterales bacterium]
MTSTTDKAILKIRTAKEGFYKGFNKKVTVSSKLIIAGLVIWASVFPDHAEIVLNHIKTWSFSYFGAWYIYAMAFFLLVCLFLSLVPATGSIKLGGKDAIPEFSTFSWISMMFGAGVGIGMLTFSTVEPLSHFVSNPDTIKGLSQGSSVNNILNSYKWSYFHWGLSAWGCYSLVGLSLAYFNYNRGQPLTIRSALTPLFGNRLRGNLGHLIDISAVIATILGAAVTIGFGVSQFSQGLYEVTGLDWLINVNQSPSNQGIMLALFLVMLASTVSAISGVGKGIKWLSNINMGLSFALILFFILVGASVLGFKMITVGVWEYLKDLPSMMLTYWSPTTDEPGATLYKWQSLWWTVFYWAWWVAFAPFVGLFLARISRGRTIRQFVFGTIVVPSFICFVWFAFVGGTAIDLEVNGVANHAILGASSESQLYQTIKLMVSDSVYILISSLVVVLLLTFLVTSADSAILVVNTINSGGDESQKGKTHIGIWGLALSLVIAVLILAGGLEALKASMFVGALPFSLIMVLMAISLLIAIYQDLKRSKLE